MKRLLKTSTVVAGFALLALFGGSGIARADTEALMIIKVPFSFVADGRTLPAGRYLVEREDLGSSVLLLEGEGGTRVGRFVPTVPAGGRDPNGDVPALTFTRQGNQFHLSAVWESRTEGEKVVE